MPTPHFTQASIDFLNRAAKQKKLDWLDRNEEEYQEVLVAPMKELMTSVAQNLRNLAPGYRFQTRGFARIKTSWEKNNKPFRDWFHVSVSRDSESRYDSLPNLYFHFSDGEFYSAGGLYVPSAKQTKHIRKWIDHDPSQLETLLLDSKFKRIFKELGTERVLATKPRDYDRDHPYFEWLRLSAWYVWRSIPKKIVLSKNLASVLTEDWTQVLRLNSILDFYTTNWPRVATTLDTLPATQFRENFDF